MLICKKEQSSAQQIPVTLCLSASSKSLSRAVGWLSCVLDGESGKWEWVGKGCVRREILAGMGRLPWGGKALGSEMKEMGNVLWV